MFKYIKAYKFIMINGEMVKVKLEGNAILDRSYIGGMGREEAYYIRLFLSAEQEGNKLYNPTQLDFKVRISEPEYRELERNLKDSKAGEPILIVNGNLEVKLESVAIN